MTPVIGNIFRRECKLNRILFSLAYSFHQRRFRKFAIDFLSIVMDLEWFSTQHRKKIFIVNDNKSIVIWRTENLSRHCGLKSIAIHRQTINKYTRKVHFKPPNPRIPKSTSVQKIVKIIFNYLIGSFHWSFTYLLLKKYFVYLIEFKVSFTLSKWEKKYWIQI